MKNKLDKNDALALQQAQWNHEAEQAQWNNINQHNAKANELNKQLAIRDQSLADGSYNDNLLFAAQDRAKERQYAEQANPGFQKEQARKDLISNLQGAGKAMQDAQSISGYTHNGLDVHQGQDGKYYAQDTQGNSYEAPQDQLKPKYSIDRGQALMSMLNAGNTQAIPMFAATQDKESGKLGFAEQLALAQAKGNNQQDLWEAKQKAKESTSDDKMTGYSKAEDILGGELTPLWSDNTKATEKARNIIGQALVNPKYKKADVIAKAQEAKDEGSNWFKKDFDEDYFAKALESLNR